MNMEFIGSKLKKIRVSKGLTMIGLAEISGVTQGNISLIENGKSNPTIETAAKLGKALGVDPIVFYRDDLVPITDDVLLHVPSDIKDVLVREDIVPYLKLTKQAIEYGIPAEDIQKIYNTYAELLRKTKETSQDQKNEQDGDVDNSEEIL